MVKILEQRYRIKNKQNSVTIKHKGIKLRQLQTKNKKLRIRLYNGQDFFGITRKKKLKAKNKPLGVFVTTKKLGISIHNSERFQKRQRKKRALLEARRRKARKLTPAQKSKAKKAAKLKKKLRKLKYR